MHPLVPLGRGRSDRGNPDSEDEPEEHTENRRASAVIVARHPREEDAREVECLTPADAGEHSVPSRSRSVKRDDRRKGERAKPASGLSERERGAVVQKTLRVF